MMLKGHYDPGAVQAWISEGRVDGLILVRYSRRDKPLMEAATQAGLPIVLIAPDMMAPVDFTVRCDNLSAGRLVARHLGELGHRRVIFGGGPEDSVDTRQRLEGLQEGLREYGASIGPEQIWFGPNYTRTTGALYAERLLARPAHERPTAVVLGNDPMALGCMRVLLKHGVRVPEEMSVVGFDGTPDGEQCWPGLTTVSQPTKDMAIAACQALLESVEHRQPRGRTTLAEFAVEMLVRESTAPPRL
jgi:LacI family transcriptional regulator